MRAPCLTNVVWSYRHGWTQLCMILFDNYLLITKEETVPGGTPGLEEDLMYSVVSRVRLPGSSLVATGASVLSELPSVRSPSLSTSSPSSARPQTLPSIGET